MKTRTTTSPKRGFSLAETLIGTTLVTLVVLGALGMAAQAINASAPTGALEQARLSVLSDAVDARAATMYSHGAVTAISGGASSTGSAGSNTSVQGQTIAFTYGSLAQASLPLRQGAPAPNSFVYSGLSTPSPAPSGPVNGPSPGPTGCAGMGCGSGPGPTPTPVGSSAPVASPTPSDGGGDKGGGGGGGGHGHDGQ